MDFTKPIEIAKDIYWVGYVIPDDPFQCHVYLIKNGDNSILIDPGSMITFPVILEKITSIISLRDIKYIIMHHQDPDIVGCYNTLESLMPHTERYIVTHWRSEMLLKHYQWKTPFFLIDENDWSLKAGKRELEFVFTPYAHFPGAFCTYDKKSGILFSSDLFGGITSEFELYAKSADEYFEAAKPFHKHYIPNKEVLNYALLQVEKKKPKLIAPQHGSIIKEEMIEPLIKKLSSLDCGLYLLDNYISDLEILSKTDEVLKSFLQDTVSLSSFEMIIENLFNHINNALPELQKIEITAISPLSKREFHFFYDHKLKIKEINSTDENYSFHKQLITKDRVIGNIFIKINKKMSKKDSKFLELLLNKISAPMSISLEKEIILRELEISNKSLYQKSITDPLTGLYNREYAKTYLEEKLIESRRYNFPISLAMIDIDFFKKVNDNYGHLIGDCVLREISHIILTHFRGSDTAIRYGGEEMLIILPFASAQDACKKIEKLREDIENYLFCKDRKIHITISAGVSEIKDKTSNFENYIKLADDRLYKAKKSGRNRVVCQ